MIKGKMVLVNFSLIALFCFNCSDYQQNGGKEFDQEVKDTVRLVEYVEPFLKHDFYRKDSFSIRKRIVEPTNLFFYFTGNIDSKSKRELNLLMTILDENNQVIEEKTFPIGSLEKYEYMQTSLYDHWTKYEFKTSLGSLEIREVGVYRFDFSLKYDPSILQIFKGELEIVK